jgi:hypothetical protein
MSDSSGACQRARSSNFIVSKALFPMTSHRKRTPSKSLLGSQQSPLPWSAGPAGSVSIFIEGIWSKFQVMIHFLKSGALRHRSSLLL